MAGRRAKRGVEWSGRLSAAMALLAVAGCGETPDKFAPACPRPAILAEAGDIQRYRNNGHDFLDTTLQGRITSLNGSCSADGSRTVVTEIRVGLELVRGPAATGRNVSVPFFVAVSRGNRILDKQVYTVDATFPENTDHLRLTGDPVTLRLPVDRSTKADVYQITAGFQLTQAELAANRQRR